MLGHISFLYHPYAWVNFKTHTFNILEFYSLQVFVVYKHVIEILTCKWYLVKVGWSYIHALSCYVQNYLPIIKYCEVCCCFHVNHLQTNDCTLGHQSLGFVKFQISKGV